jgi:hypothetical protein
MSKCEGCGEDHLVLGACILKAAIYEAPCIYCHARPGELCVTCTGKESPQWHMQRVGAGHTLLVARGTPCLASRHIQRMRGDRRNKGHTRQNWHRNKERLSHGKRVK